MNVLRRKVGIVLVMIGLAFVVDAQVIHAAPSAVVEQVNLEEEYYNIQIIVQGDAGKPFEVDLELPDGTVIKYDAYDGKKMMYLEMEEAERRWLINVAAKGTYKLHMTEASQTYTVTLKEEKVKPTTTWVSPANTTLAVNNEAIQLAWSVTGDYTSNDRIQFIVKPQAGGKEMVIGESPLEAGSAQLTLPATLVDGQYSLQIVADNKTYEGQAIDPKVTLNVKRGTSSPEFQLTSVMPQGDVISFELEASKDLLFEAIYSEFTNESGEKVQKEILYDTLIVVGEDQATNKRTYLWTVALPEGNYEGKLQLVYANQSATPAIAIEPFTMKQRDWSNDKVEWMPEAEKINELSIQVKLMLTSDTNVTVIDSAEGVLYEHSFTGEGKQPIEETISLALIEGDHLLEVILRDPQGATTSYSKRYLIDRTPPKLTMIQPQGSHTSLAGGKVSGFTDLDSVVIVNGKELKLDAAGYFQTSGIKNDLSITVRDAHGNETYFQWQPETGSMKLIIIFIVINAIIIAAAVFVMIWLRRKYRS